MRHHALSRISLALASGALVVLAAQHADAGKRTRPRRVSVVAQAPLGLQGSAGHGATVVIPFQLQYRNRRLVTVEVEWGRDLDGDGVIADGSQGRSALGVPRGEARPPRSP